jgi:hypothetical protein
MHVEERNECKEQPQLVKRGIAEIYGGIKEILQIV